MDKWYKVKILLFKKVGSTMHKIILLGVKFAKKYKVEDKKYN